MIRTSDIFELRLFDQTLATFSFGDFDPVMLHEVDERHLDLLPAGMKPTSEGLWHWLFTRAIPQNRRFATEICRSLGLSPNDRSGIITVGKGLSLNDSYWVVPANFPGTFAEYNLFENEFSAVLSAIAYTGVTSNQAGLTPSTPELTTNGNLRKAWRIEADGTRRLYKGSSANGRNDADCVGEARAEFLASQVAQAMGLNAVRYDLSEWSATDTDACSTCACFCTPELSYVPQALAFDQSSHTAAVKSYLSWGIEQFEGYASMMVFDALICNTDRHLTNFGILRDSRTGAYLGCAPLFDNGRSLFFNLAFDQADDFCQEAQFALPSWPQVTFEEQAARLMGERQIAQLQRLASFEFENSTLKPFPEDYLAKLARFIRQRAETLAALPPVSRTQLQEMAGVSPS